MYLQNKYSKCYFNIINRAKSRELSPNTYTEKHHIIPKCLGGNNSTDNLVKLTAREHFICHKLLTKMVLGKNKSKMFYAYRAFIITNPRRPYFKIRSSEFEKLRSMGLRKGIKTSEETKNLISKANSGNTAWNKGVTRTAEERLKISATRKARSSDPTWNIRPPCSDEKANKIKLANMGKRWIHNKATKERKYIDPLLVADYVTTGWELGLGPKS